MSERHLSSVEPQTSIFEKTIDNPELEARLERRETQREVAAAARKLFTGLDDSVKADIATLDLADVPIRIGRFIISESVVEGRSVSFDIGASRRIRIRPMKED